MSDHELQPLHSLQAGFEGLAGLDQIELGGIVGCLGGDGGIVRGGVKKGRMIEIWKDCYRQYRSCRWPIGRLQHTSICLYPSHRLGDGRCLPLDLIELWLQRFGHVDELSESLWTTLLPLGPASMPAQVHFR